MATADQLRALIESHGEGDDDRFYSVALQVAAQAARSGHGRIARELRDLVDQHKVNRGTPGGRPVPLAQPRGELAGLLTVTYPKVRLDSMALDEATRGRLYRVVREQVARGQLREHGFAPQRRLLLVGPPGTGKTMTASALAGELALPLFTVLFDGLISKFLGETAAKLRMVFEAVTQVRGVYLFDEFDALGGERSAANDVGEIRRVLNAFLQFLEQDHSDSVIVAATNHPDLLDRALFRRFDVLIPYALPDGVVAERIMRARLSSLDAHAVDWSSARRAAAGLSHAEITRACEDAAKQAILDGSASVSGEALVTALDQSRAARGG
ncbi:MAG: ATP-binding protein [Myxococcales bacterium]|nr:ATP-binding protein [Myxococcales bacterium]